MADARDQIKDTLGAAKSVIANGRTLARPAGSDAENPTASPTRKTPLRDAVAKARVDVKKVVTHVRDNVKKTSGAARDKANTNPKRSVGAAP